jgi:hypothetical protein
MNSKSEELFHEPLHLVSVIHSKESYDRLVSQENDWVEELEKYDIPYDAYIHRIIDFNSNDDDTILNKLTAFFRMTVRADGTDRLIMDITNGKTFEKVVLSIFSYILNLKNVFSIDIQALLEQTSSLKSYLSPGVLLPSYRRLPRNDSIDNIGYLSLTEIHRYRAIIGNLTASVAKIDSYADVDFLQNNLLHSIEQKMLTDAAGPPVELSVKSSSTQVAYRSATSSIFTSFEELVHRVLLAFDPSYTETSQFTLGQKLSKLFAIIAKLNLPDADIDFLAELNRFLLYLRNSTTHKGKYLLASEAYKAELSVSFALSAIKYYTDVVFPLLKDPPPAQEAKKPDAAKPQQPEVCYYGLDGDKTGTALELLFYSNGSVDKIRSFSNKIVEARKKITARIKQLGGATVFAEGDDILFSGRFSVSELEEIKTMYNSVTGMTCSIAYANSFRDLLLSMKTAKTTGNAIYPLSNS